MIKLNSIQTNDGQIEGLPANPRFITQEDFENLKMRILKMPQYLRHNPLKVEESGVILGGNMRYRALQSLAAENATAKWVDKSGQEHTYTFTDEIPDEWVIRLTDYTIEQKRAIVLLDNAQNGQDDYERLANEWEMDELKEWGNGIPTEWDNKSEDIEENTAQEDNFDEEKDYIEVRCQKGDLWKLGDHSLLCGDSTNPEDVKRLMTENGVQQLADLWLTDPPYNVAVSNSQGMTIINDNLPKGIFGQFLTQAFSATYQVMRAGASFYVWFASSEHVNFENALNNAGLFVRQELIWNKNHFILGRQDYQWKHEPCLYGWKEGAAHYFFDSRKESSVIADEAEIDITKLKKEELVELLRKIYNQHPSSTILNFNKPTKNTDHPTMKPVELFGYLMRNSSHKGDIVLDTFGGSGTTIIAAEQLNRKARCMELDPHYCDVILARWEKLTNKKAEKL